MNVTICMGKLPPFEIEDATDAQIVSVLKFVETLHEPEVPMLFRSVYAPKLEDN